MVKRIATAFVITILLLSSAQLLLYRTFVLGSTDIQPATSGAQASFSGSSNPISWHWDRPPYEWPYEVVMSADGSYMVARRYYSDIYLFHKSGPTPVWTYSSYRRVRSVDISADGNYIVAGAEGGIWIFSKDDNTPIWEDDWLTVRSVAISSDGSYMAAASSMGIFVLKNRQEIDWYPDITDGRTISISADGQYIAFGGNYVYLLPKDLPELGWKYYAGEVVHIVAISVDGSHVVAAAGPHVYFFSSGDNTPIWTFTCESWAFTWDAVESIAISSDGSRIAVGDRDSVYYLTKNDNTPLWVFECWWGGYHINISSDGEYVAAISGVEGEYLTRRVYIFREDDGGTPFKNYEFVPPDYAPTGLTMSQWADYIAYIDNLGITFREVGIPGKTPTVLTVAPSTFTLDSEDNITLTATLTSEGTPLAGKTITWTKTAGGLSATSGITNENGQTTVTYTAPSISDISVTVSASFAGDNEYRASTGSSSGTITPAVPPSALIESEYSGFFLHNVNAIRNTYRVTLTHAEDVDRVVFQMDNNIQTVYPPGPYEATYNMGNVGLNPTLNVTVYLTDGRTLSENLSPTILKTPAALSDMINYFYDLGKVTVTQKANGCWKMKVLGIVQVIKAVMDVLDSPVPFNIGEGDYDLPIPDWELGFTIESDDYNERVDFYSFELSTDKAKIMGRGKLSFNIRLSGGFTVRPEGRNEITDPTMMINVGGDVSWTYKFYIWVGIPVTVTVSPHFGALLGLEYGGDHPIAVKDISGYIEGGVEVSAGVDIMVTSAGAYFDGTIYLYFVAVPSFDFEKVKVTASVGVYIEALGFEGKLKLWEGSWSSNPGTNISSQSEVEWKLNERDYLGPGYSTLAWAAGNREGPLVENVYSSPQPSLAVTEDGAMVAAWTHDDPGKDFLLQAFEIAYSIYDPKQRTWSAPATITSDDFFDSNPKLTYMGDGRVLAVWQRVPHLLENTVAPFAFVENIELAYSILDLNTSEWSTPQLITSNSTYEAPAALASCGGKTYLVYSRDSDNNIFTLDNQTLVAVEWTGEDWGVEEIIASGITVIGSPRLSLAGANDGILTFVQDTDDNIFTTTDREVFYLRYDGSWGTPTRLTTNNIWEASPSAGRANNRWYLSWVEMEPMENERGYTTSVRFGELVNGQLVERGVLFENQGVTDQSLLGEIQDKLYLLYQVGARGIPRLIRYDGSAWENVENFQWSPKVENALTSQLSVPVRGNHLGAVGVTEVQAGAGASSMSLHASTFSLYTITASVEPSGGGSVTLSPSEGPYVAGTEVTVTANAAPGYKFDHWSGDATGTSGTITISIDSNKNITAHFVEIAETPWALIGGIAAVVIVCLVAVLALLSKRKAK